MTDITAMDKMLRRDVGFVDYMSARHREKELLRLNDRIAALQKAKEGLEQTPIVRMSKKRFKNAQYWCKHNDWTNEDAILFVQDYLTGTQQSASSARADVRKTRSEAERRPPQRRGTDRRVADDASRPSNAKTLRSATDDGWRRSVLTGLGRVGQAMTS